MMDTGHDAADEELFSAWVRAHGKAVRGFLAAMVRRWDLADDLTQEVFCRAWQARSRYREQGNARAYLLRIADRLACDHGRKSQTEVHLDDNGWKRWGPASRDGEPADAAQRSEDVREFLAALDQLSDPQRRVLLLRYYGQLSFAEISEMAGWPLNTTLSHCHRGLKTLRNILVDRQSRPTAEGQR